MQVKKHKEDWDCLPQITSEYFCNHTDELLNRIAQEKISFRIFDKASGIEVIICPTDGVRCQKFATFSEQMEEYYGIPIEDILKNIRWECTEESW